MPQITELTQIITHTGPPLVLATAPFLAHVDAIYRCNPSGGGFSGYVAGGGFNTLAQLEDGQGYVVYSNQVGYLIPDVAPAAPSTPVVVGASGGNEIVFLSELLPNY